MLSCRLTTVVYRRTPYALHAPRRCLQTKPMPDAEAYLERVDSHPGVVALALNRPQAKNAISLQLLKELRACVEAVHADSSVRVLVLRSSTPGAFCAGADLVERRAMSVAQVDRFLVDLRATLARLEGLPVPTIAAIDGPALGGGLELALACDLRVAGHSVTKIGLPEVRLGIIPAGGGTQRATRVLGVAKAKDLILTARSMTGPEALEFGLVNYVSEPGVSAYDRALRLAEVLAGGAPLAMRAAKHALTRAQELDLESGLDLERALYEPLYRSRDRNEALLAFKEKRAPHFTGE